MSQQEGRRPRVKSMLIRIQSTGEPVVARVLCALTSFEVHHLPGVVLYLYCLAQYCAVWQASWL